MNEGQPHWTAGKLVPTITSKASEVSAGTPTRATCNIMQIQHGKISLAARSPLPVPAILLRNLVASPATISHWKQISLPILGGMSWQIGWPLWIEDRNSSRSSGLKSIFFLSLSSNFRILSPQTFPQLPCDPEALTQATQNGLKKSERRSWPCWSTRTLSASRGTGR